MMFRALGTLVQTFFVFSVIATDRLVDGEKCTKVNTCTCSYGDGTGIDLSPLASSNGNAQFPDVLDQQQSGDAFSWNPCIPFNEGDCNGVAVCQTRPGVPSNFYFNLGTQDSADFTEDDQGKLSLQYSAMTDALRTTNIALTCDKNTENFVVQGEQGVLAIYDMELTSQYACRRDINTGTGGISVGSVLCLCLLGAVSVYLLVGVAYSAGIKKKRGKEMVPNYEFWSSVPSLIKGGVLFVVKRGKTVSYDKV